MRLRTESAPDTKTLARAPALRRLTTTAGTSWGRPPRKMNPVRITQKTLSGGDNPPFGSATIQKGIAACKSVRRRGVQLKLEPNKLLMGAKKGQTVEKINGLLTVAAKA